MDLLGAGRVIAIDINHEKIADVVKSHPRISLIEAPALDVYSQVAKMITPGERVLVIEDSAHTYEHTLDVLRNYSQLIGPGDL